MNRLAVVTMTFALTMTACSSRPSTRPEAGSRPSETVADSQWAGQNPAQAEELLAGRFPGVEVIRVAGGIAVRIRGASTVYGSNEPLYVIDGITIEPGPGGALAGINPLDIEKIEVLKDAGSIALYGSRGANGVIVIRTKRGPKQ